MPLFRKKSEVTRGIAKTQAALSREGGPMLSNADQIKLGVASLKNIMRANRQAQKESGAEKNAKKARDENENGTFRSR